RPHSRAPVSDRAATWRDHPGGGTAAGSAGDADPRRGDLWTGSGAAKGRRHANQVDLRADRRCVDTDWSVEAPHGRIALSVDNEKAAAAGLSPAAVAAVVRMAGSGESAGLLHDERAREDVPIVIRLPRADRTLEAVQSIRLHGSRAVAVGEL